MKNTLFVTEILRKIKKYQNLSLKYVVFKKKILSLHTEIINLIPDFINLQ
jgi:hypothetical protein